MTSAHDIICSHGLSRFMKRPGVMAAETSTTTRKRTARDITVTRVVVKLMTTGNLFWFVTNGRHIFDLSFCWKYETQINLWNDLQLRRAFLASVTETRNASYLDCIQETRNYKWSRIRSSIAHILLVYEGHSSMLELMQCWMQQGLACMQNIDYFIQGNDRYTIDHRPLIAFSKPSQHEGANADCMQHARWRCLKCAYAWCNIILRKRSTNEKTTSPWQHGLWQAVCKIQLSCMKYKAHRFIYTIAWIKWRQTLVPH